MTILRGVDNVLDDERFKIDSNQTWDENFFFIQGADTQLGLMNFWGTDGTDGIPYPDSNWDQEMELCKVAVDKMNKMEPKPAFFIVCGDLVDAFPDKYPDIRTKQEKDLKEVFSNLTAEIPMICVCGNHDVGNSPTQETIERYKQNWGDDRFCFAFKGVFFIVLNSQFYQDSTNVPELYKEHEEWLEKVLEMEERKKCNHTVVFQHIPWFLQQPDEADQYFNVDSALRKKKLDQFYAAGIRKIFCGHYHRNAGGFYKDLEVVVTSAIGCQIGPDQHGMRIVKIKEKEIQHDYHALAIFPSSVDLS